MKTFEHFDFSVRKDSILRFTIERDENGLGNWNVVMLGEMSDDDIIRMKTLRALYSNSCLQNMHHRGFKKALRSIFE